jgi:hypothetical protein
MTSITENSAFFNMTYLEIKSSFASLKNYIIEGKHIPIYELVNSFTTSEDNLIKIIF